MHGRIAIGLVPVLTAVIVMGCVQQRPPTRTAEQDCYRRISQQPSIYTPREIVVALAHVRRAQRKIRSKAYLKTFGKPAPQKLPTAAKLAKAEAELANEKREADAVNRRLDEIETRADAVKMQMGMCFGVGFSGKNATEKYIRAKETIAKHRQYAARNLAKARKRHQNAAKRASYVARWRVDNASHLKRKVGSTELEIVEVARLKMFRSVGARVTVTVTNTTSSTILRPRNWPVWGHGGSIVGGRFVPINVLTTDSFNNFYKVARVKHSWATSSSGLRPGETVFFDLEYAEMPLKDTRFVRIILAYERDQSVPFEIPAEVFFGGIAGRSQ